MQTHLSKTKLGAVSMPVGYRKLSHPVDGRLSNRGAMPGNPPEGYEPSATQIESGIPSAVMLLGVTYNTNNYGVRVLLSGAIASLAGANETLDIRILDYQHEAAIWDEPTPTGAKTISLVNLRFSWKVYLPNNVFRLLVIALISRLIPGATLRQRVVSKNPWLKQIMQSSQHFSLAGGDSFSDIYGLERLLYVALPQVLVLLLDKPLILLPQTYGPFKRRASRWIARYILRRATRICSRDQESVEAVKVLIGDGANVEVAPDVGFAMESEPVAQEVATQIEEWRKLGPMVGLNISKLLYMGGYTGKNMFGLKQDYPTLVSGVIDFLIRELHVFVLLVPHVYGGPESGESELMLYRQLWPSLQEKYPNKIAFVDQIFNHRQVKFIIGRCDAFIGARMHACIAAASQYVPTIALAYSDKFAGVMRPLGEGARVVDLRSADVFETSGTLREAIANICEMREHLRYAVPTIKASLGALFTQKAHGDISLQIPEATIA
jgi:colanic acid/amylovoran biosynthesis protein